MTKEKKEKISENKNLPTFPAVFPLVPVRDLVVCPGTISPILVGRPGSVAALEEAQAKDKLIVIATQKKEQTEDPKARDLYKIATLARILQVARQDNNISMLIEGLFCVNLEKVVMRPINQAVVSRHNLEKDVTDKELEASCRVALQLFTEYGSKNPRVSEEVLRMAAHEEDSEKLYYLILGSLRVRNPEKMDLLGQTSLAQGYRRLSEIMARESELQNVERRIMGEVRQRFDDQQRSYFLSEHIKALEQELGKRPYSEADEYISKLEKIELPKQVNAVVQHEIEKLEHMAPFSPESTVVRNYLDWIFDIPWNNRTIDSTNLKEARKILDISHYGLKEAKDRVLEYLAVRALRTANYKGKDGLREESTVLCLTGPPGVGKTTLAKSIAKSLGRNFVRISLGGVDDESEIRGHRRTYIGSMPGRVVQALKKAGSMNPVILLDEIDKLSSSYHGDPTAALLEVLDPEQNRAFNDHFLEIDLDLSEAIFICTANVEDAIHPTLRDRMEKIELTSYTEQEKLTIARNHLLEKQRQSNGLEVLPNFSDEAILHIIRDYTCESGVRQLDREIAGVMRKLAVALVTKEGIPKVIDAAAVRKYLGTPKQFPDMELPPEVPGVAVGLAWTEVGGAILKIEAIAVPGKGDLLLTGQLGDVMQESARAALTFVKKSQKELGLEPKYFSQHDIHIHIPEGAIPKDGPSAGITLACVLHSILVKRPLLPKLAMTGEITLTGSVLPIGGVKEKFLAAHRAGVREIIFPKRSEAELDEVPKDVLKDLTLHPVETMDEVIAIAFPSEKKKTKKNSK